MKCNCEVSRLITHDKKDHSENSDNLTIYSKLPHKELVKKLGGTKYKTLELKATGTINEIKFYLESISNSIDEGYNNGIGWNLKEHNKKDSLNLIETAKKREMKKYAKNKN